MPGLLVFHYSQRHEVSGEGVLLLWCHGLQAGGSSLGGGGLKWGHKEGRVLLQGCPATATAIQNHACPKAQPARWRRPAGLSTAPQHAGPAHEGLPRWCLPPFPQPQHTPNGLSSLKPALSPYSEADLAEGADICENLLYEHRSRKVLLHVC